MTDVDASTLTSALTAAVPGLDLEPGPATDHLTFIVPRVRLLDVCRALRDTLRFDLLAEVTAVDFWPAEPRFEVVYHVVATEVGQRLRLKVRVSGDDAHVPTVHRLWASGCWLEREVWDLFGIVFDGHGDLRRLLMPEDWEGHPLRKDYPVQIKMTPKVYAPLQMTEQEFQQKIVADRTVRGGTPEERRR